MVYKIGDVQEFLLLDGVRDFVSVTLNEMDGIVWKTRFLPLIWAALDENRIAKVLEYFLRGDVTRFLIPGSNAVNILMVPVSGQWCGHYVERSAWHRMFASAVR